MTGVDTGPNMLRAIQEFTAREKCDPRSAVQIFGYCPYYAFRRRDFERVIGRAGLGKIARKKINYWDVVRRVVMPLSGAKSAKVVTVINGNDRVLVPDADSLVMSYYSPLPSAVKLESLRFICWSMSIIIAPFYVKKYLSILGFRCLFEYVGDALYYLWLKRLLKDAAPVQIDLTVSYSHYAVIAAAKFLNIPTTEYQHGAVSHCHIGYCGSIGRYFPDRFVALNAVWASFLERHPIPLDPNDIEGNWVETLRGFDITSFLNFFGEKRVLIIGQETVHTQLFDAYKFLKSAGMKVTYRHHPRMKAESASLQEQLDECDVVVGSYSTVLVDAAANKKVVLVESPGIEFLDILKGNSNAFRLSLP